MDAPSAALDEPSLDLDHPRFRTVWASIFTRRLTPDCMTHRCAMLDAHRVVQAEKLDACCQYGCDVDLAERAAIEARSDQIRALLRDEVRHARWFDPEEEVDADYPSGRVVRTEVHDGGCIFLAHDRRGCAIHRAAIEGGWDIHGVKPAICRLFPLSYEADAIVIADEYEEYSCAHVEGPSLYRISRDAIAEIFGQPLVAALDDAEARVLAAAPRRLPVL
jgi:Fe-S-cluster containining protein